MGAALVALLAGAPLTGVLSPLEAQAQSQVVEFDIPSQPIASALVVFARQAGVQLVMSEEPSGGARANAVRGALDRNTALAQLLEGTGYQARFENGAIRLRRTSANSGEPQQQGSADGLVQLAQAREAQRVVSDGTDLRDARGREDESEEEIVVVGTNIRGVYPASSPVEIFTAEDIARTGATTTEQFIQKLPQNLGTRTQNAVGATAVANRESVNSVDLRGLGVGTTLTLLNGRRLALASNGQSADLSLIPVSALERVEVLTDGASAIYGSDAVGGVVNFVLRDDFDGAETRLSYGGVTSGGLRQGNLAQTFGRTWRSGHGLISYDYFSASALGTLDRSYAAFSGPGYLTPVDQRNSALMTLSQGLWDGVAVSGDFSFSRRGVKNFYSDLTNVNPLLRYNVSLQSETEQYFANLGAEAALGSSTTGSVLASFSEIDVDSRAITRSQTPAGNSNVSRDTNYSVLDLTAKVDGVLFSVPAGAMRFSLGAGIVDEEYQAARAVQGAVSGRDLGRRTMYAFGEAFIPIVGSEQDLPFMDRLELSLALRYTNYEDDSDPGLNRDFGSSSSPKVGLLWAPWSSLSVRATYGTSFRAPSLTEIDPTTSRHLLLQGIIPVAGMTNTTVMQLQGPSPELDPETADSFTVGLDYRSTAHPGFRLGLTYFSIDYIDRIAAPSSLSVARANPAAWPDIEYRAASAAQIAQLLSESPTFFNSTGVSLADLNAASLALFARPNFWIEDARVRNLSLTKLDGIDLSISGRVATDWGELNFGGQLTRMLDYQEQSTSTAPIFTAVDTVLRPSDLRARGQFGFRRGDFESAISVNYVDDYRNPQVGAAQTVESWTTVDWSLAFDVGEGNGTRLGLSVQNLADEHPPSVQSNARISFVNSSGFDPANANPLGRVAVLSLTKRW